MGKLFRVKLYNYDDSVLYETKIDAWDEDSAMELAWDEFLTEHCYADAQEIDDSWIDEDDE